MKLEALPSREWKKRMYLLMLFAFGAGIWFFYDAYVGYPKQIERATAYDTLEKEDRLKEWPKIASERGWVEKDPGSPKTPEDLKQQRVWGFGACAVGVMVIGYFLWARRFRLTADDDTIYPPMGDPVRFDEIREFDMKKWNRKGIAVAIYERGGTRKRLALDDWKYAGAEAILREARSRLGLGDSLQ
jgi:hypothetical protein